LVTGFWNSIVLLLCHSLVRFVRYAAFYFPERRQGAKTKSETFDFPFKSHSTEKEQAFYTCVSLRQIPPFGRDDKREDLFTCCFFSKEILNIFKRPILSFRAKREIRRRQNSKRENKRFISEGDAETNSA